MVLLGFITELFPSEAPSRLMTAIDDWNVGLNATRQQPSQELTAAISLRKLISEWPGLVARVYLCPEATSVTSKGRPRPAGPRQHQVPGSAR